MSVCFVIISRMLHLYYVHLYTGVKVHITYRYYAIKILENSRKKSYSQKWLFFGGKIIAGFCSSDFTLSSKFSTVYTYSFLSPQNQSTKDNEKFAEITFLLFGRWKVTNKIIFNKEFQLDFKKGNTMEGWLFLSNRCGDRATVFGILILSWSHFFTPAVKT